MKIERISENQIRCTLTSFDLSVRNLNLKELAYGSEKARNLFREMLQKASSEIGFETEDIPLMVEAIPLSNESVMLLITKVEDPEELDPRFAKFSPDSEVELDQSPYDFVTNLLDGADNLKEFFASLPSLADVDTDKEDASVVRVYRFYSLDSISNAAKVSPLPEAVHSALYKKPNEKEYYLVLSCNDSSNEAFNRLSNLLSEYGSRVSADAVTVAFYEEHYDTLIPDSALEHLSKL
ncbi:MAG: adaptor protein MecA [bacterium]|nr:adaptor protein MecA [bacterium]